MAILESGTEFLAMNAKFNLHNSVNIFNSAINLQKLVGVI